MQLTESLTEIRATEADRARAHYLRSLMYANAEFMANVRRGWEEEQRDEGMSSEEYRQRRGL